MDNKEIFSHIDHTNLKIDAKWEDIEKLCKEAIDNKMASVCIPPSYVKKVRKEFKKLNICTVVGFPNGYSNSKTKEYEIKSLIKDGADELDAVINITMVKNGEFKELQSGIKDLKKACGERILKVIIETSALTEEEIIKMCEIVINAKADFIKTSTGFNGEGAKLEHIELIKKHIGKKVKIKASGGIRTKEDMIKFIEAGCERIGTSSAMKIAE